MSAMRSPLPLWLTAIRSDLEQPEPHGNRKGDQERKYCRRHHPEQPQRTASVLDNDFGARRGADTGPDPLPDETQETEFAQEREAFLRLCL